MSVITELTVFMHQQGCSPVQTSHRAGGSMVSLNNYIKQLKITTSYIYTKYTTESYEYYATTVLLHMHNIISLTGDG